MSQISDPIQRAFESAVRDFKVGLKNDELYDKITSTKSIDEVYDFTDKLQEEQARTGSLRHLSKLEPYLTRLGEFVAVVDSFGSAQMMANVTALLCGPIKLLLQWASVLKQSLDAIVDITAEIGLLLPEFTEVAKLFRDNTCLHDIMVLFFKDILDFYAAALAFFGQPRLRSGGSGKISTSFRAIFEALWPRHRSKIEQVAKHIERHASLMRNEVRLADIREEHAARLRAWQHFEQTEMAHQRQEYNGLKTDINPPSYEERLHYFRLRLCSGTGDWLLRDQSFEQWLNTGDATVKTLWLRGIPGAGKSFLATTVIDAALSRQTSTVGFAFLHYKDSSGLSALSIIHSLIFQMATQNDDVQAVICQHKSTTLKSQIEVATVLLKTVLDCAGPSHIVIDGLDEIDIIERSALIKQLLDLSTECNELKVLFSSRNEADISTVLREKNTTTIEAHERNAESIQAFVHSRSEMWYNQRQFIPEMREELNSLLAPLAANAKGMFLYARIVLDTVKDFDDVEEIREELRCLPESLDQAYGRVLTRINNLKPPRIKDRTLKVLGWIGCTPTPLTTREISQALGITLGHLEYKLGQRAAFSFETLCGPIVEVVDDYVQFVHFTVHEYIFSPSIEGHISYSAACNSLAACVVTYICQEHHDAELDEKDVQGYVLSGAYTLNNFATNFLYPLLSRCLNQKDRDQASESLLRCLDSLCELRRSSNFQAEDEVDESSSGPTTTMEHLQDEWPNVYRLIQDLKHFQDQSSRALYSLSSETRWIHLDPLTTSGTAVAVHDAFDHLPCGTSQHMPNCICHSVPRYYGNRPHFCPILSCARRRNGFSSRAERNAHLRDHDKPWKCDVQGCEYAEKGFLSRRMRDDHLSLSHRETPPDDNFDSLEKVTDTSELNLILLDLVKADQVTQVQRCLADYQDQTKIPWQSLRKAAAQFSSKDMMETLLPQTQRLDVEEAWDLGEAAVKGGNLDTSKYLAPLFVSQSLFNALYRAMSVAFSQESEELCELWIDTITPSAPVMKGGNGPWTIHDVHGLMFSEEAIRWTANQPDRELYLLSIWAGLLREPKVNKITFLGAALVRVAGTTASITLAGWLLERGVHVDFRLGKPYPTSLQAAAKKDSHQAALLLKFLLFLGADPTIRRRNRAYTKSKSGEFADPIEEEKGPKNIFNWLGISWAELVKQAASVDKRTGDTSAHNHHDPNSEGRANSSFSDQEESQGERGL